MSRVDSPTKETDIGFFRRSEWVANELIGRGENWDKSLSRLVLQLHRGVNRIDENGNPLPDTNTPPKIIFITATTAIPYGISIKECWKKAFPNEKSPAFFVLDVSDKKFQLTPENQTLSESEIELVSTKQVDRLRQYGATWEALSNVAVFDEWTETGETMLRSADVLRSAGYKRISFCEGRWGLHRPFAENQKPIVRRSDSSHHPYLAIQSTANTKNIVHDFKTLGLRMTQEIKARRYRI